MIKRRKRERSGIRDDDGPIRCPQHLQWVRGNVCIVAGKVDRRTGLPHVCEGKIEAMHYRGGHGGGIGQKPGDDQVNSGCSEAHRIQHQRGERQFEIDFAVNLENLAKEAWSDSPARIKYENR